jgi:hypothetical protein
MPTFANTIDNNEILAKRSQCDYAGNDIQTTYATKSEVTTGLASKQDTLSAGNGIDITNNVVSADLDGTSLTNGANGLSVTLPVPDTTGASQGDVLSVGQSGIEWVTPGGGGGDDAVLTYNVSTWSDFTTAYNAGKNIRVVETVNGTTYEAVLFECNPNGSPYGYAKFTATTMKEDGGSVSSRWYQISNIGSGAWTHGAGTMRGNLSGQGAISVRPDTHIISLTLDGSSLTQSSSGLAVANPLPSTLGTAGQVLQVNSGATGVEWATPSGGGSDVFVAKYNTTTWTDVSTAYADGKVIFLEVTDASIPFPYRLNSTAQIPLAAIRTGSVGACAVFIGSSLGTTTGTGENTSWPVYILGSNNTWTTQTRLAYPSFTSSDYNKVLTVVNNGSNFPVLQWSATQSGGVTDVEVNGSSVVNASGVAEVTVPAQVNADWNAVSGAAEILNKPTIPTVPTAGNMLSVTNNVLDVTTTAGITDVQQVAALPAQTVPTVLYLIPET